MTFKLYLFILFSRKKMHNAKTAGTIVAVITFL